MSIWNIFKKKRPRELGDLDKLSLSSVNEIILNQPKLKNIDEILDRRSKCPKCLEIFVQSNLSIVIPEILLGDLVLCECQKCHERCYRERESIK